MHQQAVPDPAPRVLHLAQPVAGGVPRVVLDLVEAQLAAGTRVAVGCPGGQLAEEASALGADVYEWRATRSPGPGLAGEVRRVARLIAEVRPALVHAHSAKAGLAARLALRGRVPTVFQPHAWSFEAVGGPTAAFALRWERAGARWVDRLVCVSEAERARGVRAGVHASYAVIPNGVDTTRFSPAPTVPPEPPRPTGTPDPTTATTPTGTGTTAPLGAPGAPHTPAPLSPRTALGLTPATPLAICVGRLCRQKGQDVLLAAWDRVRQSVPDAHLVLVGDGPDLDVLRQQADTSVHFTGAVGDVVPWYRAADVVVLPSRWEGMALAPLEALACGRPVVVTDVDGARESLPPELAAHCLVPPENPGALAPAVAALLSDASLGASLGALGRRHVLSTHDVRHTAERFAGLYRELLGARPPVPTECRESIHS